MGSTPRSTTAARAPEQRDFKMHANLLRDIIFRQAGTREKAVLEAVMNSVDAGASRIDITLSETGLVVEDDGRGFPTREEIVRVFEWFGEPHEEGDATFGRFRMGRGQLFAKGTNVWRSRTFEMRVDAKARIGYDLQEDLPDHPGCRVDVAWYEPLRSSERIDIANALRKMVKWVAVPVRLNDERISEDPATAKWDLETPEAWFKFRREGNLWLYNLGVYVHDYYNGHYGVGGVVVSKRRLDVNFARNEPMSDCPVWTRVRKTLAKQSGREIRRAGTRRELSEGERAKACRDVMAGTLSTEDFMRLKLFTDVTGAHWSMRALLSWMKKSHTTTVTSAPSGDQAGDVVMQQRLAFVFDEETWQRFGVRDVAAFRRAKATEPYRRTAWQMENWTPQRFATLRAHVDTHHVVIPEPDWTPTQALVMEAIRHAQGALLRHEDRRYERERERKLTWGRSEAAQAWTDGASFIALNVKLLPPGAGFEVQDWIRIALRLHHEYCHADSTVAGHLHGPEFAERYQSTIDRIAPFVHEVIIRYVGVLESARKRMKQEELRLERRLGSMKDLAAEVERRHATVTAKRRAVAEAGP